VTHGSTGRVKKDLNVDIIITVTFYDVQIELIGKPTSS
jgi:hypothetical protein